MKLLPILLPLAILQGCAPMLASQDLARWNCSRLDYEGQELTNCIEREKKDIRAYRAKTQSMGGGGNWQVHHQNMLQMQNQQILQQQNWQQQHEDSYNQQYWQQQQLQGKLPAVIIQQ